MQLQKKSPYCYWNLQTENIVKYYKQRVWFCSKILSLNLLKHIYILVSLAAYKCTST